MYNKKDDEKITEGLLLGKDYNSMETLKKRYTFF
jgi:hypothetical protein